MPKKKLTLSNSIKLSSFILCLFTTACGIQKNPKYPNKPLCRKAGVSKNTILALTWFPQYCANKPKSVDCNFASQKPQPRLTLHGLWPNYTSKCGIHYGYCGNKNIKLTLASEVINDLKTVMPAANDKNLSLIKHEWIKHGSCQKRYSQNDYFTLAAKLTKRVSKSNFGKFLTQHAGKTISQREIRKEFANTFPNITTPLQLICQKRKLKEVRIELPQFKELSELANNGRDSVYTNEKGNCKNLIFIQK